MNFIDLFEQHAEPYGYDMTRAKCGCCHFKNADTEHFYRGWSEAVHAVAKLFNLDIGENNGEELS